MIHDMMAFYRRYTAPDECDYLAQCLGQDNISDTGVFHQRCVDWLTARFGCCSAHITPSGYAAMFLAVMTLDLEPGDEAVISSYACPTVINCLLIHKARPVFAGIDHSGSMNPANIEKAITEKTRVIVVNHFGGHVHEIDLVSSLAKRHGVVLIEDCATAVTSEYRGQLAGTFGDLAVLSFNEKKDLSCGEGGALIVNNADLSQPAKLISRNGVNRYTGERNEAASSHIRVGFASKVSDLTCALLYSQMVSAETIFSEKRKIYREYRRRLRKLEEKSLLRLPYDEQESQPNGNTFYIRLASPEQRDRLRRHLQERGIPSMAFYGSLYRDVVGRQYGTLVGDDDGYEFDQTMLRLPIYCGLDSFQQDAVIAGVYSFYNTDEDCIFSSGT